MSRRPLTSIRWSGRRAATTASTTGAERERARLLGPGAVMLREAGEQIVHLAGRGAQRLDHVGAEGGVVGVALGVAGDEAELADQILDVVHDEGEAAVELVEAARVAERLLPARLGEIARHLPAGDAEQVEILPVERAIGPGPGEDDDADQPIDMDQRHRRPCARLGQQPFGHRPPPRGLARVSSKARMRPLASSRRTKPAGAASGGTSSIGQFHRVAATSAPLSSGDSSSPPGDSVMSAIALTTRRSSGAASSPGRPSVSVKRSHSTR